MICDMKVIKRMFACEEPSYRVSLCYRAGMLPRFYRTLIRPFAIQLRETGRCEVSAKEAV